jgi:hypothetical protein
MIDCKKRGLEVHTANQDGIPPSSEADIKEHVEEGCGRGKGPEQT